MHWTFAIISSKMAIVEIVELNIAESRFRAQLPWLDH